MVFLIRSSMVVSHWSSLEMESYSFTCSTGRVICYTLLFPDTLPGPSPKVSKRAPCHLGLQSLEHELAVKDFVALRPSQHLGFVGGTEAGRHERRPLPSLYQVGYGQSDFCSRGPKLPGAPRGRCQWQVLARAPGQGTVGNKWLSRMFRAEWEWEIILQGL